MAPRALVAPLAKSEETVALLLDRLRAAVMRRLGRLAVFQRLARERPLRLVVVITAHGAVALLFALLAPVFLLAWGPLLLGLPHLWSDLRYLVVRRALLPRRVLVPMVLLFALCVAGAALGSSRTMVLAGLAAVLAPALLLDLIAWRRGLVLVALAVAAAAALRFPRGTTLVIAHGHNYLAVLVASLIARGKVRAPWLPILLGLLGVALIGSGLVDGALLAAHHSTWLGYRLVDAEELFAPEWLPEPYAARLVVAFAFAQAVHYGAWLRLVPDAERAREGLLGYRRSLDLLRRDFGPLAARLAIWAAVALPVAAVVTAWPARGFYFTLAAFHGYLELGFLVALLQGRGPVTRPPSS